MSRTSSQKQLQVGAQTVAYTLTRTNRKSIGITIRPDMRVEVRAPLDSHQETIDEVMQKRARWILRHLQKFAQNHSKQRPSTKPVNGAYLFLGRSLPLKILELSTGEKSSAQKSITVARESVTFENDSLLVKVKEMQDTQRVEALLENWSREQAMRNFTGRMLQLLGAFRGQIQQAPMLKVRRMKARWGSCSSNGSITLNLRLIHLSQELIDYVIVHELCHLIEHNHSPRFYALLTRMMPDWKERRQRLNELGMPE